LDHDRWAQKGIEMSFVAKGKIELNGRAYSSGQVIDERDVEAAIARNWAVKRFDVPETKPAPERKAKAK
jgi:hypothetical protein